MKEFFSRINPTVKGITLAFLATLGMANVYVFSKAALLEVSWGSGSWENALTWWKQSGLSSPLGE